MIDALLEGIEVRLDTNYFENREAWDAMADKILFTGCIDEFFNYQCGRLEYRSLRFDHRHLDIEDYQGNAVVNYTAGNVPYTRVIEHKHFEYGTQPTTVITYEYPDTFAPGKEPYYPVNDTVTLKYSNPIVNWRYRVRMFYLADVWLSTPMRIWMIQ